MSWWILAAIAVSIVSTQIIGFLWYGQFFVKPWLAGMGWDGLTDKQLAEKTQGAGAGYALSAGTAAIATSLLWLMLVTWDILGLAMSELHPALGGALFGLLVWGIGYLPGTTTARFFEQTDGRLWAIGASYWGVLAVLWGLFVGVFSTL